MVTSPGTLPVSPSGFLRFIDKHFKVLVWILMAIQVLKGTALYPNSYARGQYLWDYADGLIKRGLVGTLTTFLTQNDPYRLLGVISFLSYSIWFFFLWTLYRFILKYSTTPFQKVLSLVFLASPFLIAMGSLLGYFDALILAILLTLYRVCDSKEISLFTCVFLVIIALLIHEVAFFFVVIPLFFQIWMNPDTTLRKKLILIGTTSVICLVYIVFIYFPNPLFTQHILEKTEKYKHILSTKSGEEVFVAFSGFAIKNSFLHDVNVFRYIMLVVLMPIYAYYTLITNWIVVSYLFRLKKFGIALFYLASCYAPLLIIIIGWDIDRFVCLGICTAYLNFLVMSRAFPGIAEKAPGKWQLAGFTCLSLIALLSYYPISLNYGEGETLLSKDRQNVLLHYPVKIVEGWKSKMEQFKHKRS